MIAKPLPCCGYKSITHLIEVHWVLEGQTDAQSTAPLWFTLMQQHASSNLRSSAHSGSRCTSTRDKCKMRVRRFLWSTREWGEEYIKYGSGSGSVCMSLWRALTVMTLMVVNTSPMISNQHPQCVCNPSLGVYSCSQEWKKTITVSSSKENCSLIG